jgi:hypothetical protein
MPDSPTAPIANARSVGTRDAQSAPGPVTARSAARSAG